MATFYGDRDSFVASPPASPSSGDVVWAGGYSYEYESGNTDILDVLGWRPLDRLTPKHFGAPGLIKSRTGNKVNGWLLSDKFPNLTAAQAVYPKATSLSETLDRHAAQRMIDSVRDELEYGTGGIGDTRMTTRRIDIEYPTGQYVFDGPWDCTDIRTPAAMAWVTGKGAVVYNQSVGNTWLDLVGTPRFVVTGFIIINELLPGAGCPRCAIMTGRNAEGKSAGEHRFEDMEIIGFATLACHFSFGSEVNQINNVNYVNHHDPDLIVTDFTSKTGNWVTDVSVTWPGGTGKLVNMNATVAILRILTGSPPSNGATITRTANGATIVATNPYRIPAGEGPGDRSFVTLQDAANHWKTNSQFADNDTEDHRVSCLLNTYRGSFIHSGRGHAMAFTSGCVWVDLRGAYPAVTGDNDGAAGLYLFARHSVSFDSFCMDGHIESDGGDSGAGSSATGVDYEVLIDAYSSNTDIVLENWVHRSTKMNAALATYKTTSNVRKVTAKNHQFALTQLGDGDSPDPRRCWGDPDKWHYDGYAAYLDEDGIRAYLNLAELADFAGIARVPDIGDAAYVRPALSGAMIVDANQTGFMDAIRIQAYNGVGRVHAYAGADMMSKMEFREGDVRIVPDADDGTELLAKLDSGVLQVYWDTDGEADLGLPSKRWRHVRSKELTLWPSNARVPQVNGELVVEATNNTTLKFKYRGSDGTVRTANLTLS